MPLNNDKEVLKKIKDSITLEDIINGENVIITKNKENNTVTIATTPNNLPIATSSILGGVKIGDGINRKSDGTIYVSGTLTWNKKSW